ncbi:MAG: hypothetical protein HUU38_03220 [Anaerolineales bacterium]|nr:hypothetical protein [Anaerolineales bacterium]
MSVLLTFAQADRFLWLLNFMIVFENHRDAISVWLGYQDRCSGGWGGRRFLVVVGEHVRRTL